jgi:hypothetical protein
MTKETKWYSECWYKVEYQVNEYTIDFRAFKIDGMDEEDISKSTTEETSSVKGFIKWDGCMEFTHEEHYCGLYHAEQTLGLMKEIYIYKGQAGGNFQPEN